MALVKMRLLSLLLRGTSSQPKMGAIIDKDSYSSMTVVSRRHHIVVKEVMGTEVVYVSDKQAHFP